ncbi:MAG: right-handed parallel beta-helix repeat-containing protein [Spirochaetes bacterium]|nr:right-handed parallel beta-helix repeat-containing protein [Spirochaetota bacterium]
MSSTGSSVSHDIRLAQVLNHEKETACEFFNGFEKDIFPRTKRANTRPADRPHTRLDALNMLRYTACNDIRRKRNVLSIADDTFQSSSPGLTGLNITTGDTMINFHITPDGDDNNSGAEGSPWKTLHRAAAGLKEHLARKEADGEIIIHLAPGVHTLRETLILGLEHGGGKNLKITFRGSDKGASIISSGIPLLQWTKAPADLPDVSKELAGRVWVTELPRGTRVNTLYGPKDSIPRARGRAIQPQTFTGIKPEDASPNYGPNGFAGDRGTLSHGGFVFTEGAIDRAQDLAEAEFVIIPKMQWTMNILPCTSVDFDKRQVTLAENCTYPIGIPHCAPDGSIWLENSLSVLKPGSWVYHRATSRLYYCPEGDAPEAGLEAGSLTEYIRLEGVCDPRGHKAPIENIHLEKLSFTCSNRFAFHGLTGKGIQHDWEMHDAPSSMVRLRHAQNCSVTGCTFEHGGSGGVRLDLYAQGNRVEGNTFRNLGMCGVLLCGYGPSRHYLNRGNTVRDNHIHHIGEHYWHCPGIFIWQSGDNHIAGNHIHDTPYTAIVCSGRILYDRSGIQECSGTIDWVDLEEQCGKGYVYNIWWYSGLTDWWKREPLLHARENLIEYNHIHDVMQVMGDGNGIYISGAGGGNVVRFNAVGPCPSPTMSEGIRCDDDQHHTILHGNLIFAQGGTATGITLKGVNRVTNNIFGLPLCPPKRGHLSLETGPLNGSVIKHNIFLTGATDQKAISEMRIHGTGRKARLADTDSDHNLFYCTASPAHSRDVLEQLQSLGTDYHSLVAEPGFVDAAGGDYTLKPNAAALSLGFKPLPLEKMLVGRKKR